MDHYVSYKDLMFLLDISRNEAKERISVILEKEIDNVKIADEVLASKVTGYRTSSVDTRYHNKNKLVLTIEAIGGYFL